MSIEDLTAVLLDQKIITREVKVTKKDTYFDFVVYRNTKQFRIPFKTNSVMAYLCGVILGDGSISQINRKANTALPYTFLKIFNQSLSFLIQINILFKKNFGVDGKLYKKKYCNCYVLQISNKIAWLYFVKFIGLPIGKKSNLCIPKFLLNKTDFKYFIAGLMDTDGYFSKNSFGIMLSGSNLPFLESIKKYCNSFYGINFRKTNLNTLEVNGKQFQRVQITTSTNSEKNFREIIPLCHEKWDGPGEDRTHEFHRTQ